MTHGNEDDLQHIPVHNGRNQVLRHYFYNHIQQGHADPAAAAADSSHLGHAAVEHEQADGNTENRGDNRGTQVGSHQLAADAPDIGRIGYAGQARNDGKEHNRGDHHIEGIQEHGPDAGDHILVQHLDHLRGHHALQHRPGQNAQHHGEQGVADLLVPRLVYPDRHNVQTVFVSVRELLLL